MHYCEGGYDRIARKLFNNLNVDCYYVGLQAVVVRLADLTSRQLEYDTERSGALDPLKYLPLNKVVVLGLVTTKTGKVRHRTPQWQRKVLKISNACVARDGG